MASNKTKRSRWLRSAKGHWIWQCGGCLSPFSVAITKYLRFIYIFLKKRDLFGPWFWWLENANSMVRPSGCIITWQRNGKQIRHLQKGHVYKQGRKRMGKGQSISFVTICSLGISERSNPLRETRINPFMRVEAPWPNNLPSVPIS